MEFTVERIYETHEESGTYRVLVDRLWPRGVSKVDAKIDLWSKDVTPSAALRQTYHAGEMDYADFSAAYSVELEESGAVERLVSSLERSGVEKVVLLTAVKDVEHSHMPVLLEKLEATPTP